MAAVTYSVKLDTERDAALVEWLQSSESKSQEIKAALYHYRNLPPPKADAAPAPSGPGMDLDLLKSIIDYAIEDGAAKIADRLADVLTERLRGMTFPIPLNEVEPTPEERNELEEATANFLSAFG